MSETRSFRFARPRPFDARHTFTLLSLGPHDPALQSIDSRGWQALRWVNGGLCRVVVGYSSSTLAVRVDGPTAGAVGEEHARALLGLADDTTWSVAPRDPVYPYLKPGLRLVRVFWLYEAALNIILSQRVSWREAVSNWQRLCRRFGESRDGLSSAPSPEGLRALSLAELASCGIEAKRARPLKEVAARLGHILAPEASGEEIEALVHGCRGVGPWTRALLRAQFWGDPDSVPLGDYGLPGLVCAALAGERHGTDQRMLELLEPYRGHRFRVIRHLWADGGARERRGPRLPIGHGIG